MPSKADVIREYVAKYPDMKTGELTALINEKEGIDASAQVVSKYRGDLKKANAADKSEPKPTPKQPAPKNTTTSGIADTLVQLKTIVETLGGKEETKKILDMFPG